MTAPTSSTPSSPQSAGQGAQQSKPSPKPPSNTAVSVTLLLRVPKGGATPLRAALVGLTVQHNIKIHVDDMPDGALYRPTTGETK